MRNCFQSRFNTTYLGVYKTLEEAIEAHDKEKRIHIKQVANEYKDILPTKVYKALLAW